LRKIGVHLRIEKNLVALIKKALELKVDFFQCFLTQRTAGKILTLHSDDINEFVALRQVYFKDAYLHISYWVNLSSVIYNPHRLFKKEIALAKRLAFTHVIIHPGSSKGAKDRIKGIDALAKMLNKFIKAEPELKFTIENVAQGPPSIGGNIEDLRLLLEKIDQPERLYFCIDTGHAYSHGYNLADIRYQETFIDLVDKKISWERVVLIHFNDTPEKLGSKIDKHVPLGEGKIGKTALKSFILHPRLASIPVLIEPPLMSDQELKNEIKLVMDWCKNK